MKSSAGTPHQTHLQPPQALLMPLPPSNLLRPGKRFDAEATDLDEQAGV